MKKILIPLLLAGSLTLTGSDIFSWIDPNAVG